MSAPNITITLHPEMHREIDDSLQTSRLTRSAMLSVVAVSSARSSSSQRRPRAIDATTVARFSERIGRACCGDIPSGRRIAILRSVSLRRVIPPRQFCDQMSLSDNIIQKVLAFRAPLERYCPRDRFDTDCVLGTQFVFALVLTEISPNPAISPESAGFLRVGFVSRSPRLELRRLIGPFVSGLKIPFPGNGDLGSKRLRFEWVF